MEKGSYRGKVFEISTLDGLIVDLVRKCWSGIVCVCVCVCVCEMHMHTCAHTHMHVCWWVFVSPIDTAAQELERSSGWWV